MPEDIINRLRAAMGNVDDDVPMPKVEPLLRPTISIIHPGEEDLTEHARLAPIAEMREHDMAQANTPPPPATLPEWLKQIDAQHAMLGDQHTAQAELMARLLERSHANQVETERLLKEILGCLGAIQAFLGL